MDKQVNKPLEYKVEHVNLWDSAINAKNIKNLKLLGESILNTNKFSYLIAFSY